MTYRVLAKKLRKLGCEFTHQAPGSHEIWWNPKNRSFATIPRSTSDITKGTLSAILRDLGLTLADLSQAH
jgi:predicted RNA binding protein YcfA (HicA-like mRNA interferase family)